MEYLLDQEIKRSEQVKGRKSTQTSANPRYISAQIKREVLVRAQGCCEYPGCFERHYLEWDHIVPLAHGGKSISNNIRLLCKSHNQLEAIRLLGLHKMKTYF